MKKLLMPVLIVFLILFALAFLDFWSLPNAPGSFVDVGSRKVHVHCLNPANGQPPQATIWLESGSGVFSPYWFELQRRIAKESVVRTCTYDRAGMGWSEDHPGPLDVLREGKDAYATLSQVDGGLPLILVGHSYGGATIRITANEAGHRVKGMVYLDSATIRAWRSMWQTEEFLANVAALPSPNRPWPFLRLINELTQTKPDGLSDDAWTDLRLMSRMQNQRSYYQRYQKEAEAFPNALDVFEQHPPPAVSSVYIAHSPDKPMFSKQLEKAWFDSIPKEFGINRDNFSLIVTQNGDHNLVWSEQDLVYKEIMSMANKVISEGR